MNKVKKLFNKIAISFALLGTLTAGAFFVGNAPQSIAKVAGAEFTQYENISNNLPEFVGIETPDDSDTSKAIGKVNDTIYLFQKDSYKNIVIADDTIVNSGNAEKINYAYIPEDANSAETGVRPNVYYYFDFHTSLSLYYNLTNEDIKNGATGENLLANTNISDFAQPYSDPENDKILPFAPTGYSFNPQKFDLKFTLNTSLDKLTTSGNEVKLAQEGCYTLAMPVSVYSTDNDGLTFVLSETTVYYTFMIFEADTYFDTVTGRPNISPSTNIQESLLNQSSAYSNYYFYNFAYGKAENTLPTISYNPERFELRVEYTDLDQKTSVATVEYIDGNLRQLDEYGIELTDKDKFIQTNIDANGRAVISFTELGSYDLSIGYLYIANVDGVQTTYSVPLEELENNDIFNNKPQRLFVYGYQAVYSDYSSVDSDTNQPESKELKTFDFNSNVYDNSADITSLVNSYVIEQANKEENADYTYLQTAKSYAEMQNPSKSDNFDLTALEACATSYINSSSEIKPVTTNQTPVKFLTNTKLQSTFSKIYKVSTDSETNIKSLAEPESFQGFNQNSAGTYLYIIQYTFDSFMSTSGTLQSGFYHYQIFYFTVTNTTPTITVYDEDFSEIYTGGYTNKNVYILNDAENNIYDAKVDITLSAYNYKTKSYFFPSTNINNLSAYGISYQQFEASADTDKDADYNESIAGKWGILIENDSAFANALFTIQIKSANTDKPSTRTFTIDTNPIKNIIARNASISSSTAYRVGSSFDSYSTNNPFILSWDKKDSGATTYGYVKYIPLTSINYYSSISNDDLAALLSRLIDHETLPVSYKLNLENASSWTEYSNTLDYTSTVPATNVKLNDGIYILEVYDQAGNSSFEIFMKDSTSPIFVQKIESRFSTMRKLFTNNQAISVPESNVNITIEWTKNKAIYLENVDTFTSFTAYQYGIDTENATKNLKEVLENFFNWEKNSALKTINDITVETTKDSSSGYAPTGITSYNGTYLIIPINDRAYLKDAESSDYSPIDGNSYKITFIDENGQAIEGTYKLLIRDASNTDTYTNEASNYKLYPSGYLSFNVTSDASKMMVKYDNGETGDTLDYSSYSITGNLYKYEDENKEIQYSHTQIEDSEQSDLTYKFMYHTPIKATRELYLSYIPVADNGSRLESIVLRYYPYELKTLPQTEDGNFYYYYDIAQEPTRTINVFTVSDKTYNQGEEEVFSIALGTDSYPLAGRYIIERIYVEGNETDQYDYYKRTISFIVDDFNLISPLESITDKAEESPSSSLESVVGGDIVLSMYSGEGLSSIEVSFPSYNDKGLNSGSFYTKDSFSEEENLAVYAIEGNKLPMSLYIPKYKYTTASYKDVNNKNKTTYSVATNDNLSYYGNATYMRNTATGMVDVYVEGVVVESFANEESAIEYINNYISIVEYEIKVEIMFTEKLDNNKTLPPVYYYSNGTTTNGYLNFYLADGKNGNIVDASISTEFFFLKGDYVVTIYQASNDPQSNFYDFYRFGFKINSQEPDFTIYGSDNYQLTDTNLTNVYYTNSDVLTIEWQVPTSKYQAKIDEHAIKINYFPSTAEAGRGEIIESAGTKYFTIDTSKLIQTANSYIEITMQYEGYNSNYYNTITKRVYFDRSAPTQNLSYLMTLTESATNSAFPLNYQQYFMRKYFDYQNEEVSITAGTDLTNMSYSYSVDSGYFKYYSYNVTSDFFNTTLKSTLTNASTLPYDTQYIYFKAISSLDSYTQVDKSSFNSNNYINLIYDFELSCGYYEVVELDYAGNMTVYVIYVVDSSYENDENVNNEALSYINNTHDYIDPITNDQIVEGFNIYSNSGFQLTNLNYKADPWALINVTLAGQTSIRYMKSPWLEENSIYKVSFTANGIAFEEISLSRIFKDVESSSSKHQIVLTDRIAGTNTLIYLSIMDASINTQKVEDPNKSSAILNITIPTKSQYGSKTTSYAFPTKITIKQFDKTLEGTDKWKTIMIACQKSYGSWEAFNDDYQTAFEYISFNTIGNGNILQVVINLGERASQKIKYEIEDNFGNTTTVIQLANEISYNEVSGDSAVYQITEADASITYVSSQTFRYSYNILLYNINIFDKDGNDITDTIERRDNATTNISVFSFVPSATNIYDDYYKIIVQDSETDIELKTLHLRLFYNLPYFTFVANEVHSGGIIFNDKNQQPIDEEYVNNVSSITVNFNGKPYTSSGYSISSYDNVTIKFKDGQSYAYEGSHEYDYGYTYSVYLSRDNGQTWENINSDTSAISGYTITGVGDYLILVKYDSNDVFTNLCKIFTVSVIDQNLYPLYSIRVDNLPVEKSNFKYTSQSNVEYEINYIVSVDYADKDNRLTIIENEEKGVVVTKQPIVESTGTNVYVEIYSYTSEIGLSGYFTIIYIDETNNIVSTFTYDSPVGTTVPLKDTSYEIVVAEKGQGNNYDKLKLNFSAFYGIKENKINVEVLKLFNGSYVNIDANVYDDGEYSYVNLERAGAYRIKVYDSCTPANVQSFNGNSYIDIVFLSTVPFLVSHVDDNGNTIITEPIQKAIYNSDVKIDLLNVFTDSYYQRTPKISVLFNGKEYTDYQTQGSNTFIFTEPGFYTVKFSAESKSGMEIREEEFNFTIIKKNEIRYAYEFTEYSKYYIEKVEKDGTDITNDLVNLGNFKTVVINGVKYLSGLTLSNSLIDEKTGDGRYKITINLNSSGYSNVVGDTFTFELRVGHVKSLPINISVGEGESTSENIVVSFNVQNLYNTVGDCYVRVAGITRYYTSETLADYGEVETITIVGAGTHYIQVYTLSGRPLYSYKVIKTEPLNAFAIIAIIVGAIALVAIIIITIKIRKRQKAK